MPVRTGHAELEARDATCGCTCPETKEAAQDCTGVIYGGQRCAETIPWNLNEDQCRAIPIYLLPPMAEAVFPARFDACTPAPTREIPPLVLSDRVQLCEAATSDCDDGVCTPTSDPPNGVLHCIWREGDPVCPDPAYPLRYVFYEDVRDERDCSPCTCGEQAACRFRIYTDTTCKGEHAWEAFVGEEGVCESILDIVQSQFLMSVGALVTKVPQGPGFCEPSTPVPAGAAVEIEPFTVCCRQ
jgi:hypothetical protein